VFLKEDQDMDLSLQTVNLCISQKILYFSISEQELSKLNQCVASYDTVWSTIDLNT
jgi:hypothetical protein